MPLVLLTLEPLHNSIAVYYYRRDSGYLQDIRENRWLFAGSKLTKFIIRSRLMIFLLCHYEKLHILVFFL